MEAMQAMDMNKFIIIAPTMLIAIYLITTLQKRLSSGKHANMGLIIPIVFFIAATVLAVRMLLGIDSGTEGRFAAFIVVWLTFNIPAAAFTIPYFAARRNRKTEAYLQEAMAKKDTETEAENKPEEDTIQ